MDRVWLLTSTVYGNWLPGDRRGFVTRVRDQRPGELPSKTRREHDSAGMEYDRDIAGLRRSAMELMKGEPVRVIVDQARTLITQFQETAKIRGWRLLAAAVMVDHTHWVVGVPGDPEPDVLLRDFKAYGSRALNKKWPKPKSETWWTESGSRRIRKTERQILAGVIYVAFKQPRPLARYLDQDYSIPERWRKQREELFGERGA